MEDGWQSDGNYWSNGKKLTTMPFNSGIHIDQEYRNRQIERLARAFHHVSPMNPSLWNELSDSWKEYFVESAKSMLDYMNSLEVE